MLPQLLVTSLFAVCALGAPHGPPPPPPPPGPPGPKFFKNVTVFAPPPSWPDQSTSYARSVLLDQDCETDNVLLASFVFGPPEGGPYLPIAKSTDLGNSWGEISRVYFTHKNYTGGIILQPFLFELPQQIGKYPAGTILATGNAIPGDFSSTNIEIYASLDHGLTWEFVSVVAVGGPPNTANGATPVWEPFIGIYDNQILVYYSDQRDPLHGQKLSLQTSRDLESWGGVINAVAYANYTQRPGMATVAQIGNGKWMISHEVGFASEGAIAPYAVHYSIADSPLEFGSAPSQLLQARNTGTISSAGPYTVWTPAGGPHGTIVVSDSTYSQVFINTNNGDPDSWEELETGIGVSYTRGLRVMPDESVILFMNGGYYGASSTTVTAGEWIVPGPPSNRDTISSCKRPHSPWKV